jgi:hypothetical protein
VLAVGSSLATRQLISELMLGAGVLMLIAVAISFHFGKNKRS